MRNFYIIFLLNFCVFFTNAQDLEWTTPAPTGTGNESIAVLAGSVTLGGDIVTQTGSLVGVFYINDNGGYTCGGYTVLDESYMSGGNVAISAWGADAGEDNGFDTGEDMNFFLNITGVDYPMSSVTTLSGDIQFQANGLTIIAAIDLRESYLMIKF